MIDLAFQVLGSFSGEHVATGCGMGRQLTGLRFFFAIDMSGRA